MRLTTQKICYEQKITLYATFKVDGNAAAYY